MNVLVTGVNGQLGHDVMLELSKRGIKAIGKDVQGMDITNEKMVISVFEEVKPDVVIHCAAWTAVDMAEDVENYELVEKVNYLGTKYIAEQCLKYDAKLLYLSTDYVFDGQGERPWMPDDKRNPLNVYGLTKAKGEEVIEELLQKYFIVRIAWVFGANGNNFIKTMLKLGKEKTSLSIVNDQIGLPTYTYDLAKLLVDMIETDKYGIYQATNNGEYISWYDFAKEIFKQAQKYDDYSQLVVEPTTADKFQAKAKRPSNSRMDMSKLTQNGFELLPAWQDALSRYLEIYYGEK